MYRPEVVTSNKALDIAVIVLSSIPVSFYMQKGAASNQLPYADIHDDFLTPTAINQAVYVPPHQFSAKQVVWRSDRI